MRIKSAISLVCNAHAIASPYKWYANISKSKIERSRYELETDQSQLAEDRGREVDSESTKPPTEEEDSTTKP